MSKWNKKRDGKNGQMGAKKGKELRGALHLYSTVYVKLPRVKLKGVIHTSLLLEKRNQKKTKLAVL